MEEYTRGVKKRLTWQYLGVQTGTLRNETNAVTDGPKCYVGTIPWYGHAYETGNWDRWKGRGSENDKKYKRSRRATWTGDRKHRPFMKDTIKDQKSTKGIARRVRERLRRQGILK